MNGTLKIGQTTVDLETGEAQSGDGRLATLRPKTAALLRVLAARPGELVTKDELLKLVWPGTLVDEDGLVQCVGEIRRALGEEGRGALRTHAKRGYSLHLIPERRAQPTVGAHRWPVWAGSILLTAVVLVVAALAIGGTARAPKQDAASHPDGPVVAVLPFEALTEGERWDRLSRALTHDMIADLAQNHWLFVLADATTRAHQPAPQTAADLGATYFVTGSLQVEGDLARITAALSDAGTGRQLWSKRVEGATGDFLALQRAASEALVGELSANWNGPIARAERTRARERGIDDLGAYELYLVATDRVHSYTAEDLAAAAEMYRRVVAMEPTFGEAWAQLSLTIYNMVAPGMSQAEMERMWQEAEAAALEAYRVSPNDPHALAQAANAVRWDDPERAERMVRHAASVAPNNADILAYLSYRAAHFPALGPEAEEWIARAIRLNPDHPAWYHWNRGAVMMVVGRYADAAEAFARAPGHVDAKAGRIAALALMGEVPAARKLLAELMQEAPDFSIAWHRDAAGLAESVAEVYARGFRVAGARE